MVQIVFRDNKAIHLVVAMDYGWMDGWMDDQLRIPIEWP